MVSSRGTRFGEGVPVVAPAEAKDPMSGLLGRPRRSLSRVLWSCWSCPSFKVDRPSSTRSRIWMSIFWNPPSRSLMALSIIIRSSLLQHSARSTSMSARVSAIRMPASKGTSPRLMTPWGMQKSSFLSCPSARMTMTLMISYRHQNLFRGAPSTSSMSAIVVHVEQASACLKGEVSMSSPSSSAKRHWLLATEQIQRSWSGLPMLVPCLSSVAKVCSKGEPHQCDTKVSTGP
mmetsp:Transcript_49344/g.138190  ORF Transcript_49344/g.138190 Transcript_49344/m.138190 type:complete len:232 (-) Transcript_49344:1609-2304(-)